MYWKKNTCNNRNPSPLHAWDDRSHRESEFQSPANTSPAFSSHSQPAIPAAQVPRTPHHLPGRLAPLRAQGTTHSVSPFPPSLCPKSVGLTADVNLLPRGQHLHGAYSFTRHLEPQSSQASWQGCEDTQPPSRPVAPLPPLALDLEFPEPTRTQGRSDPLACNPGHLREERGQRL